MEVLSFPGHSILICPNGLKTLKSAASEMSQGTPPRNTLHDRAAFWRLRWGSWPDHVQEAS